jgi:hypothetical protein
VACRITNMPTDTLARYRKLLLERTQYGREEWKDAVFALLVQSLEASASVDVSMFLISPHHWEGRPDESSDRRERIRSLLLAKLHEHSDDPTAVRNYCLFLGDEDADHGNSTHSMLATDQVEFLNQGASFDLVVVMPGLLHEWW